MKDAIIFDLDGTLWDSSGEVYKIWNSVFERHPEISLRIVQEDMGRFMGKTTEEIGSMLFPERSSEYRMQIMDECGDREIVYLSENGAVLYDAAEETLRRLKETYDLFIVSNCQDGYVNAFMSAHRLEHYFTDIEMSGRTGKHKGENIKLIIERNHIGKCIYVGDTEGDEKAARYAGIPFIYAKYGFGKAVAPDASIDRLADLPEIVRMVIG